MLSRLLKDRAPRLSLVEVGARPVAGQEEPCHRLLADYPGSTVASFEVDPALCAELNLRALPGQRFYPYALGKADEERTLHETLHPMCSSLYPPNQPLLDLYHNLEVARLRSASPIRTRTLAGVAREHRLGPIDLLKLDVQGAELDVLTGAGELLADVLAVVCEVEFVPLYEGQPLFGDVCALLSRRALPFHKFLGVAGRSLKPVLVNNDANFAVQHLWADALYVRDPQRLGDLAPQQLLKLAAICELYRSPDVAYHALLRFDGQERTQLAAAYLGGHRNGVGSTSTTTAVP